MVEGPSCSRYAQLQKKMLKNGVARGCQITKISLWLNFGDVGLKFDKRFLATFMTTSSLGDQTATDKPTVNRIYNAMYIQYTLILIV